MINVKIVLNQIFQKTLLLLIFWNSLLFSIADMRIEITCGVNTAHPIAVIPFTSTDQSNLHSNIEEEDIASIISSDLRNSGKFNTLPVAYLPHQPTKVSDIIPMFWEKLGVNMIVLGSININHNNNYIISYQLIDASNNPALVVLENQYLVEKKYLRSIAHTISNEIFEKLTGIKGAFRTRIAYVLHMNNVQYPYELCIADYDGYNQISICRSVEPLMSPTWSPDGKKIAYVTFASGRSELVIQTLHTGKIDNVINFPNHNGAPAFSPDGKKLAFSLSKTGSLNLYIMDLSSGKICQLTSNRYNNTEPSWFPDNQNLAYTSDQGGKPQVYKININNTTNIQRLSWLYSSNQNPNINVDGTFLVMVNRNQGKQNISKLNLETGREEILTTDLFLADTPSLAPNGTMMIYSSIIKGFSSSSYVYSSDDDGGESVLELISIDGRFKAYLKGSSGGSIRFPSWSPF